ncbi:type I-D CRISPR-associated protein Cas7/Csc2 [Natroniella acetigena]|uniref:type I-D CRISPR-associated protein Cas7/Csc2 n=1 Tax=Natroniella acetigena TaxID=52004 RepID=UPI00200B81CE|nr:type I-D CRISPR-associated protein Cas7/Csc2 [Natroniella acetigena]MCK8826433.1 type I-D CRISPR-associated protein Cas7/Csc2 [Natroniella acetigena]
MKLEFNSVNELLNVGEESKLGNSPVVTIMGMKRTTSNFLPVSHDGEGNETYVDKIEGLLSRKDGVRAEFIARKQEGIERRGQMNLLRNKVNELAKKNEYADNKKIKKFIKEDDFNKQWKALFGRECVIPHNLCISCPNCSLFGGWNPDINSTKSRRKNRSKSQKTFSRVRNFDTYSIQKDDNCIVNDESVAGMKIGNQVAEDNSAATSSNFHYYEAVKSGVYFPFIVMIERATLFDVASYLKAIRWADNHGYGKYSARNGKFQTEVWALANGHPKFSILDILEKAEELDNIEYENFKDILTFEGTALLKDNQEDMEIEIRTEEDKQNKNIKSIEDLEDKFEDEFKKYFEALIK